MKLTMQGVEYNYHGDKILRFWPWKVKDGKFYSNEYSIYFSSLREYWKFIGRSHSGKFEAKDKVDGFSYEEIIAEWVRFKFPFDAIIVLTNIELSGNALSFWKNIPEHRFKYMTKDVVVLICDGKSELLKLIDSIPVELAQAVACYEGTLIGHNLK